MAASHVFDARKSAGPSRAQADSLTALRRKLPGLRPASELGPAGWNLATLAGRLVELQGCGALTLAAQLVLEAQLRAEPVAWVCPAGGPAGRAGRPVRPPAWLAPLVRPGGWEPRAREQLEGFAFPPDLAALGIDLAALVVVRVPFGSAQLRAVDTLLRSGGFGLILIELGLRRQLPLATQSRLNGLAAKYGTAVVCMREQAQPGTRWQPCSEELPQVGASLGPLVSLRLQASRSESEAPNPPDESAELHWCYRLQALRDKRRPAGWFEVRSYHAPVGLC